jgi:hypothetical protein
MSDEPVTIVCGGTAAGECECKCPEGPCTHKWDGPEKELSMGFTVTCSKCGMPAISHDMRCF